MTNSTPHSTGRSHRWELLAILLGVVLGAVVGMTYGRAMWLASDEPQKKLDRLERTIPQKESLAREAVEKGKLEEAERLRAHVPIIQEEIARIRITLDQLKGTNQTVPLHVYKIIRFCGDIFLRMLMMIVIPLIITSMIRGMTSLGDIRRMGKVGAWTFFYYLVTTAIAVAIGIGLLVLIEPGKGADDTFAFVEQEFLQTENDSIVDTLLQVVRGRDGETGSGMIPANLFQAAAQTNILGLIVFSLLFGGALSTLGERGRPAVEFFHAANDAVMSIVRLIMLFAPVGVFGLVAANMADQGGGSAFATEVARLGWFVATVTIGLAIHTLVLCVILKTIARRCPMTYLLAQTRSLLTALSTDSSSATLPVTIECVEESGVSERAAGFVLPLGATMNMNGTALYEAVAAIFIAQSAGMSLGGVELVVIFVVATLAAMGAPGIPNAGAVTLIIVLSAVHIPAVGIGMILAIDWLVDRERTVVNVFGDAVGAAVIDRYLSADP